MLPRRAISSDVRQRCLSPSTVAQSCTILHHIVILHLFEKKCNPFLKKFLNFFGIKSRKKRRFLPPQNKQFGLAFDAVCRRAVLFPSVIVGSADSALRRLFLRKYRKPIPSFVARFARATFSPRRRQDCVLRLHSCYHLCIMIIPRSSSWLPPRGKLSAKPTDEGLATNF